MDTAGVSDQSRCLMGLFGSSMCMLIELYLIIANSVFHTWDFPCSGDKQQAQLEYATSACIYVHLQCVCACMIERAYVKGMVSVWQ